MAGAMGKKLVDTALSFAQEVAAKIEGAEAVVVPKANGVEKAAVTKRFGRVSPTVYVQQYMDDGLTPDEAATVVKALFEETAEQAEALDGSESFEAVKERLRLRLYNKATKAEVSRSAEPYGLKDLILVPVVTGFATPSGEMGVAKVTKGLLQSWGVGKKLVFDTAMTNTRNEKPLIQSLAGMLEGLLAMAGGDLIEGDMTDAVVVTNREKWYGATQILAAKDALFERYPEGFYALPSSVHEWICLPMAEGLEVDNLTDLVKSVNADVVAPEEVLGDRAYVFKPKVA